MRKALVEEIVAGLTARPSCCSVAAAPVHSALRRMDRAHRPAAALWGMLGPALAVALLVLTRRQSQASFDSSERILGRSGAPLQLQAPLGAQTSTTSGKWKVLLRSMTRVCVVRTWRNDSGWDRGESKCVPDLSNRLSFTRESLTLVIEAAEPQDSGAYFLETTNETGTVRTHRFNVSVLDPVGTLRLQERWEALDGGHCRVTLSCSVSGGGDVSYTWYRGRELIRWPSNLSTLEEWIVPNIRDNNPDAPQYTCKVSNPVSEANQTLTLRQDCPSALQEFGLPPFWVIIASLGLALLLVTGTLTCVCVRRRKRKQAEESLTVYEDVNNLRILGNQEQRQEERGSPAAGNTIYSMIQPQPSASTSQRNANTLYTVVHSSQKSGSKTRRPNPPLTCTVYDEIGKLPPEAQKPVLTRKELENFRVYS